MKKANNYVEEKTLKEEIKTYIFDKNTIIFPKVGKAIDTNKKRILGVKASIDNNVMGLIIKDKQKLLTNYLFEYFNNYINLIDIASKANPPSISATNLNSVKIPLPPKEIQEKIVNECEVIDQEAEKAQETIEKAEKEIKKGFNETTRNAKKLKIKDICEVQSGGTPSRKIPEYWKNGTINWLRSEVCQNVIINENIVKEKITELGLEKSSAKIFKKDTVLIALVGATIGKVAYLTFEAATNQNIAGLYPIDNKKLLSKYLFYALINSYDNNFGDRKGKFTMANLTMIRNIQIPVPPIEEQQILISKIEKLEDKIKQAREIINQAKEKKQQIMDKYLK